MHSHRFFGVLHGWCKLVLGHLQPKKDYMCQSCCCWVWSVHLQIFNSIRDVFDLKSKWAKSFGLLVTQVEEYEPWPPLIFPHFPLPFSCKQKFVNVFIFFFKLDWHFLFPFHAGKVVGHFADFYIEMTLGGVYPSTLLGFAKRFLKQKRTNFFQINWFLFLGCNCLEWVGWVAFRSFLWRAFVAQFWRYPQEKMTPYHLFKAQPCRPEVGPYSKHAILVPWFFFTHVTGEVCPLPLLRRQTCQYAPPPPWDEASRPGHIFPHVGGILTCHSQVI